MAPQRILVVDNDEQVRYFLYRFLTTKGFLADTCCSGRDAIEKVAALPPDLAVVDYLMPEMDGIQLIERLHQNPATRGLPAVLITALWAPDNFREATERGLGSIPIFIKGRNWGDLIGIIKSTLINRPAQEPIQSPRILRRDALVADLDARTAWVAGRRIESLTRAPKIFDLLCALLRSEAPLSKQELLRQVWPGNDSATLVPSYIRRLRKDLKDFPAVTIETVTGGYRLAVSPPQ
jgi:DNA-binding response OmpR family regulator